LVSCHLTERNGHAIEIDPIYCQVAIDRMLSLDPDILLLKNGKDATKQYRKALTKK